jgi:hypothetical protein
MRTSCSDYRKQHPLHEGADFDFLPIQLVDGAKALVPRSQPMLFAIGVVLENCLKDGKHGDWHNYDFYLHDPDSQLVVLCGKDAEMHVLIRARYLANDGVFRLETCVGKQNDAPIEEYHAPLFDLIRKQKWVFDEHCNFAMGNPELDPRVARAIQTHNKTLRMVFAYHETSFSALRPHENLAVAGSGSLEAAPG